MVEASTLVVSAEIIIKGLSKIVNQIINNCKSINEQ